MGQTIVEKILSRVTPDEVAPGRAVMTRPDYMMAYDFPGYTDRFFKQMAEDFRIDQVAEPERYVLFVDHMLTRKSAREEEVHALTREWAQRNGVAIHEAMGIGHQVSAELGYALPGKFLIHMDGHVSGLGAFGALGIGVRRDIVIAWIRGELEIEVPDSIRVQLDGAMASGVDVRDLVHQMIRQYGADVATFKVLEYVGPGAESMPIDARQTLCGMAMFSGAVSAIFNPDELNLEYARRVAGDREWEPLRSDSDAHYVREISVDVSNLAPQVVLPGSARSTNTVDVSEVLGTSIDRAFIGSCVSGRIDDLRSAAAVLEGRKIADGVRLDVVPSSNRVFEQAQAEGLLTVLESAGAHIASSSCDFCFGYESPLEPGQRSISTGVLNITGRMGSTKAEIYMGSAKTVAASALVGRIADPRETLADD